MERAAAETDPSFKQLIPYVVAREGEAVFLMHRTDAGGDARLHGRASIGVGGHLNPVDDGQDSLMAGLRREWDEELEAPWEPAFRLVGLLNDDSNPVGSVHLGVVFTVDAGGPVRVREREKLVDELGAKEESLVAVPGRLLADVSGEVARRFDGRVEQDRPAAGALGDDGRVEPAQRAADERHPLVRPVGGRREGGVDRGLW